VIGTEETYRGVVVAVVLLDDVEFDCVIENCCDWAKMVLR
jgi:hypothetical protein